MSILEGEGHGSNHDWFRVKTFVEEKYIKYLCQACDLVFKHRHEETPEIFEAMEQANVPENCEGAE